MNIGVLGTGSWGLALARMLCKSGHDVTCWSPEPDKIDKLDASRRYEYLPGSVLPDGIRFCKDLETACRGMGIVLFAVSSSYVREVAAKAAPYIGEGQIIVDVAKGIEAKTLKTMSEVIREEIPGPEVVALSGPTHAEEVAVDLPTTIVSACPSVEAAKKVQDVFSNSVMRVYVNTDIRGVELCGALKNIIALAAGISDGLGYGDNAKAAIITRGLTEIEDLGYKMGCSRDTFPGLAGMGDLIVTCTSRHSRNNRCGFLLGQGVPAKEAVRQIGMVVEGINALPAALKLADQYEVEMPIVRGVDAIVNHGADPVDVVRGLMNRDRKMER